MTSGVKWIVVQVCSSIIKNAKRRSSTYSVQPLARESRVQFYAKPTKSMFPMMRLSDLVSFGGQVRLSMKTCQTWKEGMPKDPAWFRSKMILMRFKNLRCGPRPWEASLPMKELATAFGCPLRQRLVTRGASWNPTDKYVRSLSPTSNAMSMSLLQLGTTLAPKGKNLMAPLMIAWV